MILNNSPALAPLILLLAGVLIPLAALRMRRLAFPIALTGVLGAAAVSLFNVFRVAASGPIHYRFGGWIPPIGIEYVLDPLSAFLTAAINSIAVVVLIHAKGSIDSEIEKIRVVPFFALVMLFLCGGNGIILTGDLFNLYVFLEISSLALYGLIAAGDRKSPVAAFRYLIMGVVGGSFYLLGVGFLYMMTGSLNMADIRAILPVIGTPPPVIVGLCLMIIGLGIKMALFPLHGWLPDAYTSAPSATSSIMAPIGIKIGAYGILRILFFVFGVRLVTEVFPIAGAIAWLSAAGIIYGSIMALAQKELKRMLAYSSISQIGYIGLGLGLANPMGLIGAVLHILNHGLMKACLFLVAANFRLKLGHSRIDRMDDSLRKKMPWTTAAFVIGALSMIGIPPTAGFFSKWYLALGTISGGSWHFLAVILVSSLLNAVYFFRIIERIFLKPMEKPPEELESRPREVKLSMLVPTLLFAALLIIAGLMNALIVKGILSKISPPGF
jgi:multicomponent Na+:H+ antiporter subunit D